jgi:hypothetical protein
MTEDDDGLSFESLKGQVDEFITLTQDARSLSERCRDYVDGKQWTAEEAAKLRRRKQAPIVNNRIKVKHQGLLGLTVVRKSEPKAYPRNQHDSGAAEAATDGLRYVADRAHFDGVKLEVVDDFFCEGYGGVEIGVEQTKKGDINITIERLPWDRIYYDAHSRKRDFSDARYKGYIIWFDEDDLLQMFPDANPDEIMQQLGSQGTTFDDRPLWGASELNRRRYMVAKHYYKYNGQWYYCIFTGAGFLKEPEVVPFVDEDGEPVCPMELASGYIDRENNRYSEISTFLDLQDEINHRRSKALFLLSQRQTYGNRGAVKDINKAKAELAKPDGHLEVDTGEYGKDFGVLPTGDMAQGQVDLLQEAKAEIDAQSYNAQLSGQRQAGDLSGIAIQRLQQSGVTELNGLFQSLTDWELRVYKQCWWRIRQFWTKEKWVRVTDSQKDLRWVGFNTAVTMQQYLQETMDNEALDLPLRLGASAQMIMLEQQNPQALQQVVEVRNQTAEMDMDIILDQSFDTINIQAEQLDALLKYGAANQMDIVDLIDLSNITGKDDLIERINKRKQDAAQAAQGAQELGAAKVQSEIDLNKARAQAALAAAPAADPAQEMEYKREIAVMEINAKASTERYKADVQAETDKHKAALDAQPKVALQVDTNGAMEKAAESLQQLAQSAAQTIQHNQSVSQQVHEASHTNQKEMLDSIKTLAESVAASATAPRTITTPDGREYTARLG